MATERYEYAVNGVDGHAVMPERWAQAVVAHVPCCQMWRRVVRVDGPRVAHGEWHPVDTAVTP